MDKRGTENIHELLHEFKAGKETAFDYIFNLFYKPLVYFARGILHDNANSEDLVQEMLIKLWHKRMDFDSVIMMKSFLYVGVRNACYNELEKKKVKQKHQKTLIWDDFVDDQHILYAIIKAEVIGDLYLAIDTLPAQCKKVMQMTFKEDKKPKDIAEELGLTVSTVNNQKMRGISLLKERLFHFKYLFIFLLILPKIKYILSPFR